MKNIFEMISPKEGEIVETLLEHKNIKIERIVSSDKVPDKIYDQEQDEWVLVLKGHATLDLEGKKIELKAGGSLFIEAGKKHKVLTSEKGTLWLAVHVF